MKVFEVVKLTREIMKTLQEACVKMDDCRYVELYEKYTEIVSSGAKTSYAVAVLSEMYGISERKVYYLLKRFSQDCKICAAGNT